jgi:uncharacterized damage-inducible protein DinB
MIGAMPMTDALVPEFDHEMTVTRKLLERVPEDRFDWKPHEKSTSLGGLATHLANLAVWGEMTLNLSELDLATAGVAPLATSRAELLANFDKNVATSRAALVSKSDAEMMAPWTLKRAGQVLFTMPKAAIWRSFVISHIVHHRGQLSVYLRLQNVPVPSIYGPSADEAAF